MIFVGAPLALASVPLETSWLFYVGLTLLVVALALPARPGQSPRERWGNFVRHFPGLRWLRRRDG